MGRGIVRWLRQQLEQRQPLDQGDRPPVEHFGTEERGPDPLDQLDLPPDWSVIHIPLTRQALSNEQRLAITRMAQWVPYPGVDEGRATESREYPPMETVTIEDRLDRTTDLLGRVPHPAMAAHICREELPLTEWRREWAAKRIGDILAVFPDDQIRIWT